VKHFAPPRHVRQPGPPKPHYAGKVAIRHAVEAAREAGIAIGGLELGGEGTIRIYDRETAEAIAAKDLERIS
jgi:hypothetical protein